MSPIPEVSHEKSHKQLSTSQKKQAEDFEAKLQEDNMHLFRQLRLKDFLVDVKEQKSSVQYKE
jgi:hypothetical protein